jgi:hypothetical protein
VRAVVARYIGRDAVVAIVDTDADFEDARTPWRQAKLSAADRTDVDGEPQLGTTG